MNIDELKRQLQEEAQDAGFEVVGFTSPKILEQNSARFDQFLEAGQHGEMQWLAERAEWRKDPKLMWPDVKTVIMLGMNYGAAENLLDALKLRNKGIVSVYAQGGDYHQLVKKRLKRVARWLVEKSGVDVKVFVDTAPVMEKPLAQQAGIGWQGKHTNLVSRELGSWLFLGAIFTDLEIPSSEPENDHCGRCNACQDICPTDAFPEPYQLDASKCIAYLTIEHKGKIPRKFRKAIGNRIFGCDDCLAVCPWNKFAKLSKEARFKAREWTDLPDLKALLELDKTSFEAHYAGSPVKRAGFSGFMRNVLIAAGNSGDENLTVSVSQWLKTDDKIVKGAAIWALTQLLSEKELAILKKEHMSSETDPVLIDEWNG